MQRKLRKSLKHITIRTLLCGFIKVTKIKSCINFVNFWKYDETENTLWYLATLTFMKPQRNVMCFCVISVAFYDNLTTFSESEKENVQTWILVYVRKSEKKFFLPSIFSKKTDVFCLRV